MYAQVFFLITFLENKNKIIFRKGEAPLKEFPNVTIAVPAWNESKSIEGTVLSLLNLNYPKDKLKIILIDDGSTDNTFEIMQKFQNEKNIEIYTKKNGGKHTALNFALEKSTTPFFGCLDADAFADKDALNRIMSYFEKDLSTMAVAPSVIVNNPQNLIQKAQTAEYE
ncbi:MAG: glycosyltransferase family 2 protein, partial [bacterium]|nr:glycosyltransferase family 2 protein [bacterium]